MELKQLKYFLCVAELGSFSKAAVQLSVAQPIDGGMAIVIRPRGDDFIAMISKLALPAVCTISLA